MGSHGLELVARGAIALAYVAALGILSTHRLKGALSGFAIQSLALGIAAAAHGTANGFEHAVPIAIVFVLTKAVAAPRILGMIIERLDVKREMEMFVEVPWSLFIGALGLGLAYVVGAPLTEALAERSGAHAAIFESDAVMISLALVIAGFFLMVARRKLVTQIIGLLVMENGIFIGAVGFAHGLPFAVELGAAADVFIAVLILGLLVFHTNATIRSGDAHRLRRLRG